MILAPADAAEYQFILTACASVCNGIALIPATVVSCTNTAFSFFIEFINAVFVHATTVISFLPLHIKILFSVSCDAIFGSSCYIDVEELLTWTNARDRCLQYGGNLAMIEDSRENILVSELAGAKCHVAYWYVCTVISLIC